MTDPVPSAPSYWCRRCSRALRNPASVKHGYGPVCFRKNLAGDSRVDQKHMDPCTITDPELSAKTRAAIYRLIQTREEIDLGRGKYLLGEDPRRLPLESFNHDQGSILPGYGKPQWFYLHSEKYDLAIWELDIATDTILSEMKLHGDIPEGWKT
jgi:hypothetical protein